MNIIKCSHEGCISVIQSEIPFSTDAKYTCRLHTEKSSKTIHFQEYQFDSEIPRIKKT